MVPVSEERKKRRLIRVHCELVHVARALLTSVSIQWFGIFWHIGTKKKEKRPTNPDLSIPRQQQGWLSCALHRCPLLALLTEHFQEGLTGKQIVSERQGKKCTNVNVWFLKPLLFVIDTRSYFFPSLLLLLCLFKSHKIL